MVNQGLRESRKIYVVTAILLITLMIFVIISNLPTGENIVEEGVQTLSNNDFIVTINIEEGSIIEIKNPKDKYVTNFAGNRSNHEFIREGIAPPLGEISIKYRIRRGDWLETCTSHYHVEKKNVVAKRGNDYLSFIYDVEADFGKGLVKSLIIEKKYRINARGEFAWEISVKNAYNSPIEIGELSIPLSFNLDCWSQGAYERQVLLHPFISGHSSYIYLTRPNGMPPYLLITPGEDTYFEAITGWWSLGIIKQPPPILYLYSKANENSWKEWFNGYSSLTLSPNSEKTLRIRFYWVNDYNDLSDKLYELGKVVAAKIVPGMVVPIDLEAYLLLKTRKEIKEVKIDSDVKMDFLRKNRDLYLVKLKFNNIGEHVLKIRYGAEEWVNYPFYIIENIEQLFKKRASFIINYQRITDSNDIRQHAFLMWDRENKTVLDKAPPLLDFGPGWPRPPKSWMSGCSDEIGFAEPLFLVVKNIYYPDRREIKALEDYIWNFLYGKLQNKETYGVKRWIWDDPEPGYWRSFNYPHVFSIYYCMYKIAKYYPDLVTYTPEKYLLLAYNTAMAFHDDNIAGSSWRNIGHMGQWTLLEMLEALKNEGFTREYTFLYSKVKTSTDYFISIKYSYRSEFPFDTTGYETAYYYRKFRERDGLVNHTIHILLATLHQTPIWWWYGSDIKGVGTYTTPLNARPLLDAFETYQFETNYREMLLRIGYAGILAYLSQIHPTGEATTGPDWSPDGTSGHYFNSEWSNEYGIGLYAVANALKSYIIRDPDLGAIGYGCKILEDDEQYTIEPFDGIRTRVFIDPLHINVEVEKGHISKLLINKMKDKATLFIERSHSTVNNIYLRISGLDPGTYSIYVNGNIVSQVESLDSVLNITLPVSADTIIIEITSSA